MREKLVKYWERKERQIENANRYFDKMTFFAQAFGALEFFMESLDNWDAEDEFVNLWNDEWRPRLEAKVYDH